ADCAPRPRRAEGLRADPASSRKEPVVLRSPPRRPASRGLLEKEVRGGAPQSLRQPAGQAQPPAPAALAGRRMRRSAILHREEPSWTGGMLQSLGIGMQTLFC